MNPFILLSAIGVILVVLVVIFLKLGSKDENGGSSHFALQLLILGFILFFVLIIGKVAVDNNESCAWNVANSTAVNTSTVVYEYSYDCVANTKNTTTIFYKTVVWFVRLVALYIALYFIYEVLVWFNIFGNRREEQ